MRTSPNRLVAAVFGGVYLLVGVLGLFVAGTNIIGSEGGLLLGIFQVNHVHNIAHLAIGGALALTAAQGVRPARIANVTVGAAYLLLGVVGFFLAATPANILALNTPDHVLHLASALVLLAIGLATDRAPVAEQAQA